MGNPVRNQLQRNRLIPTSLPPQVLDRRGCRLHYWVGGPVDRPLVVFTHGAGVDHRSFDPHLPAFMDAYRVMTWDVRGHGLSRPTAEPCAVPLAVEDLLAIMDRLGVERAALVGHSNGSYIAQEAAYRHPDRVAALVVASGTCLTWPRGRLERWLLDASPAIMSLLPYELIKRMSLPFMSARADVRRYVYGAFSALSKAEFLAAWNGVVRSLHPDPAYTIEHPLLLLHGDGDRTGDIRKIAPRWAAATPRCEYAVIPGASHFALLDHPERFATLTRAFLDRWV